MDSLVVSKSQLAADYENMKVMDICDKYGICLARLYNLIDKCEIKRKCNKAPRRQIKKIVIKE